MTANGSFSDCLFQNTNSIGFVLVETETFYLLSYVQYLNKRSQVEITVNINLCPVTFWYRLNCGQFLYIKKHRQVHNRDFAIIQM